MPKPRHVLVTLITVCPTACGDAPDRATIAKAFTIESKQAQVAEELEAKADAARRLEAEARREEERAIAAAVDAATVQPAELPADLEVACDAVVEAYDVFMKSGSESDALRWSDGRRRKMGERRAACVKVGKIPVIACEAEALAAAPTALDALPREEAARRLMERCHDEFG